jgi:hypothetical protein
MAPPSKRGFEQAAGYLVIVGNQEFHVTLSWASRFRHQRRQGRAQLIQLFAKRAECLSRADQIAGPPQLLDSQGSPQCATGLEQAE